MRIGPANIELQVALRAGDRHRNVITSRQASSVGGAPLAPLCSRSHAQAAASATTGFASLVNRAAI